MGIMKRMLDDINRASPEGSDESEYSTRAEEIMAELKAYEQVPVEELDPIDRNHILELKKELSMISSEDYKHVNWL